MYTIASCKSQDTLYLNEITFLKEAVEDEKPGVAYTLFSKGNLMAEGAYLGELEAMPNQWSSEVKDANGNIINTLKARPAAFDKACAIEIFTPEGISYAKATFGLELPKDVTFRSSYTNEKIFTLTPRMVPRSQHQGGKGWVWDLDIEKKDVIDERTLKVISVLVSKSVSFEKEIKKQPSNFKLIAGLVSTFSLIAFGFWLRTQHR